MSVPQILQPWSLSGKTAIVTGASRGIGRAIVLYLVKKGATRIAITYAKGVDAAEYVIEKCRSLGAKEVIAIQADLLDPVIATKIVKEVLEQFDTTTIDIVVNNAALTDQTKWQPIADTTLEIFSQNMHANVYATLAIINACMPYFPTYGGRVINISSVASKTANSDPNFVYGASKAALDSITRSYAATFATAKNATFNTVSVGPTETEAFQSNIELSSTPKSVVAQLVTAGARIGVPEDIAYIVGFLASEEGRWVNGANVSASGGFMPVIALQG
ncbi:short chain oxidoreductase [Phlyctema vagabunda]|uniref:Short chain oxidoreductase n=1 Tax=Phlyctema vagabunda TaxID=108571 RepID=A0ABR4PDI9_9HELO